MYDFDGELKFSCMNYVIFIRNKQSGLKWCFGIY